MAATFVIPATSLPSGSRTFTIDTPAGATGCFVTFTNATWPAGTVFTIEIDVSFDGGVTFVQGLTSTYTEATTSPNAHTLSASFGISGSPTHMRFILTNNQAIVAGPGSGGWI